MPISAKLRNGSRADSLREVRLARARELGEDGEVGVEPNAVDAPDAQRRERPVVFEPSELPFDGSALLVELAEARRLARDERVEAVGLDPPGGGGAFAGRAAPLGRLPGVVGPGEPPLAVLADGRVVIATLDRRGLA